MTPLAILALMLWTGPTPGLSPYSLVPVAEGSPAPCSTAAPACRAPWWSALHHSHVRQETYDEGVRRYAVIATAISAEAGESDELARVLLTITHFESGWRRDVHSGIGVYAIGDTGRSFCLGQFMIGAGNRMTSIGVRARELLGVEAGPTALCIRLTAKAARRAVRVCRGAHARCAFSVYGSLDINTHHPGIAARGAMLDRLRGAPAIELPERARLALEVVP